MIKRSIHQDLIILNVYAPNNRAAKYVKQKLIEMKEEINSQLQLVISTPITQQLIEKLERTSSKHMEEFIIN